MRSRLAPAARIAGPRPQAPAGGGELGSLHGQSIFCLKTSSITSGNAPITIAESGVTIVEKSLTVVELPITVVGELLTVVELSLTVVELPLTMVRDSVTVVEPAVTVVDVPAAPYSGKNRKKLLVLTIRKASMTRTVISQRDVEDRLGAPLRIGPAKMADALREIAALESRS